MTNGEAEVRVDDERKMMLKKWQRAINNICYIKKLVVKMR